MIIAIDADARTNANVQEALRRLAAMLQRLGAGSVLVVYVPAVNGDTKAGVDDYKAAGGTVEELRAMAAPYEPIDVGAERMARDEQMAAAVAGLQHHADELERAGEFRGTGGRTREALLRTIIAAGPERGKLRASDRGGAAELHVAIDQRTLAERCGVRQQSITKGVRRLEQDGHLERRRGAGPDGTTVYVLTCPRACHMGETGRRRDGEHHREKAGISGEYGPLDTPTGTLLDELARLRWPYVRRVWTPDGYTHEYVARLGKTKGAALRHAIEAGGAIALPELGARMGISPRHAKRHAGALLEAELAYLEGSTLHVAGDALQKLLIARELGSEYEAERLQKERHQRQRAAYRTYRERGETLAPDELEGARREKRQPRQEATQARRRRRREADKVHRPNYWLWRERQHLRETGAAGYVRDLAKVPEPEESPPPEMPPKVGDVYYHAPECACEWCEDGPESGWQSGRYVRLHKEVR